MLCYLLRAKWSTGAEGTCTKSREALFTAPYRTWNMPARVCRSLTAISWDNIKDGGVKLWHNFNSSHKIILSKFYLWRFGYYLFYRYHRHFGHFQLFFISELSTKRKFWNSDFFNEKSRSDLAESTTFWIEKIFFSSIKINLWVKKCDFLMILFIFLNYSKTP